eukprot:11180618-Lingulodinium_polyedra.AAC.1
MVREIAAKHETINKNLSSQGACPNSQQIRILEPTWPRAAKHGMAWHGTASQWIACPGTALLVTALHWMA